MIRYCMLPLTLIFLIAPSSVQSQTLPKDELIFLTAQWEGQRFDDGRPKVPDSVLDRMKLVTIEEAWGVLRNEGYHNQFEGEWHMIHDDVPVVGRALTALYMPDRPDVSNQIKSRGKKEGRIGNTNSWPIDMLAPGDVYVADGFGNIVDGT
ncbi:MAG: RraA family protein, partial [Saprospiraceae bacterium]|nr:RraA family protein [Saprospiraceae bacterium]